MDFGVMTAKIDEIGYITHAENLGYRNCWVTDSPINRLAPGRCVLGLGTGHTGLRMLGRKPMKLAPFREYIEVVRGLLRGDEVAHTSDGETHRIRFQMREHRFIDLDHPIPIYVAAFGPRAQQLAGEIGDGLISGMPRGGTVPEMLANVRTGAAKAGRMLPADFYVSAQVTLVMRQPGEPFDSERIVSEAGAAVISGLHYLVARHLETGEDPPAYARPVWNDYMKWLDESPPEVRHQRLHGSHYSFVDPDEARFITADLIKASSLSGTPEEIVERVRELEREGLNAITLYPPLNRQYRVIEDFAERVMVKL